MSKNFINCIKIKNLFMVDFDGFRHNFFVEFKAYVKEPF
jgi:hypothetical protein